MWHGQYYDSLVSFKIPKENVWTAIMSGIFMVIAESGQSFFLVDVPVL